MKRYSIVRVDGECPKGFNEDIYCKWCGNCGRLYGDTKEQLIKKVAQVIKRVTNDGYVIAYKKFGTGYINTVLKNTDVAKEIVEFLGVEE